MSPQSRSLRVTQCPDGGPLLVRGAETWQDDDGVLHEVRRPVVAVCACDRSQRMPWCDGTHKFVRAGAKGGAPGPKRPVSVEAVPEDPEAR